MFLVYLYAFVMPVETIVTIPGVGNVAGFIGAAIVIYWLLAENVRIGIKLLPMAMVPWMIIYYFGLIDYHGESILYKISYSLKYVVVALAVADMLYKNEDQIVGVLKSFAAGSTLVAVLMFRNLGTTGVIELRGAIRAEAFEEQGAAHGAMYLMGSFVVTYFAAILAERTRVKLAYYTLSAVFVVALLYSGTRSAWVGTVVATLILHALLARRRATLAITGAIVLTAAVFALNSKPLQRSLSNRLDDAVVWGGSGRTGLWQVGLTMWKEHPFLGVGTDRFVMEFDRRAIEEAQFGSDMRFSDIEHMGPHNIYILSLAENGTIGFIFYISIFISMLYWIGRYAILKGADAAMAFAFFVAYLVGGFFLDVVNRKYFWFAVAVAMAYRGLARDRLAERTAAASSTPAQPA